MIYLLLLMALGHEIVCVIPEDIILKRIAKKLRVNIKNPKDINSKRFVNYLKKLKPDLFVCINGGKVLKKELLSLKCINTHANLSTYPGNNPIERMLRDKRDIASVGTHWMNEKIDGGKVILEKKKKVIGRTESEVYNELYEIYIETFIDSLCKIKHRL